MFVVCGEALYDLFVTGEGQGGQADIDARAGGSPFNVSLGMARQGADVALLTGVSRDRMGERLAGILAKEGVSAQYLLRSDRRTTLSLVDLDASGSPSYAFYGDGSADTGVTAAEMPSLGAGVTGLHFGSYSLAVPPVADAFAALAEREAGRFIALDPNVRPTIQPDMAVWRNRIDHFRRFATLVKVSDEDLSMLYPGMDPLDVARDWATGAAALVVVTRGGGEVLALHGGEVFSVTPPRVTVVDTVGAGDTFQATLLAALCAQPDPAAALRMMGRDAVEALLQRAAVAAAITCSRRGAELPTAAEIDQFMSEHPR